MANIIDYLKWRGDLSFEISPINEIENIILARFSYYRDICKLLKNYVNYGIMKFG